MSLLPPPSATYETREALVGSVNEFAVTNGYVVTIRDSRKDKNVTLGCDRSGRNKGLDHDYMRRVTTRRIECPFRVYGNTVNGLWKLSVLHADHNHDAGDLIAHPGARQLSQSATESVEGLQASFVQPRVILRRTIESGSGLVTSRDIYNVNAKRKREELNGQYIVDALVTLLDADPNWTYHHETDDSRQLTRLCWAHNSAITFAKRFNRVYLMDATYKTNRYNRPLFHIIGMAPNNESFTIALVLLESERAEAFNWALSWFFTTIGCPWELTHNPPPVICTDRDLALLSVLDDFFPHFPHLLCIWHINKNVTKQWKTLTASTNSASEQVTTEFDLLWRRVYTSASEIIYMEALANMRGFCEQPGPRSTMFRYLEDTWLCHKERFVQAWTDNHLHLGNILNSIVGGAAALTNWLNRQCCDVSGRRPS